MASAVDRSGHRRPSLSCRSCWPGSEKLCSPILGCSSSFLMSCCWESRTLWHCDGPYWRRDFLIVYCFPDWESCSLSSISRCCTYPSTACKTLSAHSRVRKCRSQGSFPSRLRAADFFGDYQTPALSTITSHGCPRDRNSHLHPCEACEPCSGTILGTPAPAAPEQEAQGAVSYLSTSNYCASRQTASLIFSGPVTPG